MPDDAQGCTGVRGPLRGDAGGVNVTAIIEGGHYWFITWRDDDCQEALRTLGRWAANPDLPFSWYQAAKMSQSIRQQANAGKQIVLRDDQ